MPNKMISVIVPVYNASKWLSQTLDSLVNQTYKYTEIICVDDGSTDNSCEIVEDYIKNYTQVKLIKQKNSGVCAARNKGLEVASGEYVAFVDADDYVELDMYENLIDQMETEQSDIIFCEFVRFWPNGKVQYTIEESFLRLLKTPKDFKPFLYSTSARVDGETLYTQDIHGAVWRSVYKKEIIDKNKIEFHTDLRFAEDQIFVLEYLSACKKISYNDKAYVWYRGHTKKWTYGNYYSNNMNLLKYQMRLVQENDFYTDKQKKSICGYLKCSTFFMIINEEFMFKPEAECVIKEYYKNIDFKELLTLYTFIQKYKVRREPKRIALFILLKLHMWKTIRKLYPQKKY